MLDLARTVHIPEKSVRFISENTELDKYVLGGEKNSPVGGVYYHVSDKEDVDENVEEEIAPADVDTSNIDHHDDLNKSIWADDDTMDSQVRLRLLDIADDFWDFVDVSWVSPLQILVLGSMCNYNYHVKSDIDLHIVVDYSEVDENTDLVEEYFKSKKNDWNSSHKSLLIKGHRVELYVQDVDEDTKSNGIYDLEENKWIQKPTEDGDYDVDIDDLRKRAAEIITIIENMNDELMSTSDAHIAEEIYELSKKLASKLRDMRKKSLEDDGEYGMENVVYKVIRNGGYLDMLYDTINLAYDKMNSIKESKPTKKVLSEFKSNLGKLLSEEVVADGDAEHNPYKEKWDRERKALKDFLKYYGKTMTSRENGKQYKVYYDKTLSSLIGHNYCACIEWKPEERDVASIIYIRALDKFTERIFTPKYDYRGRDNESGTNDDVKKHSYGPSW